LITDQSLFMKPARFFVLFAAGILGAALAAQAQLQPAPYFGPVRNYVRTLEAVQPLTDNASLNSNSLPTSARISAQYVDGLGRPLQTVVKMGAQATGAEAHDLVEPAWYNDRGQEELKFLPFPATGNTGGFRTNPFQQQAARLLQHFEPQGDSYFYGRTETEASPLARPTATFAPGNNWIGAGRGVRTRYGFNTDIDEVRRWEVVEGAGPDGMALFLAPQQGLLFYEQGTLTKTITEDEHGKQVVAFKDKLGRILLKKVQLTAPPDEGQGSGYEGWLCTYYIYDNGGLLRCVIQPEGVNQLLLHNWDLLAQNRVLYNEQCFRYEYDGLGRMTIKKVAGAAPVFMVYDRRDRLVLTQDGNQRAQGTWLYSTYDELDRVASTGLLHSGQSLTDLQQEADATAPGHPFPDLAQYSTEELTRTYYDDYDWLGLGQTPFSDQMNNSFSAHYLAASATQFPYPETPEQGKATRGLVTGTRVRVLGTDQYLYTISFYDSKGRPIQQQATNLFGGVDIATTQYSFRGQPLLTVQFQHRPGNDEEAFKTTIITRTELDELGRVTGIHKKAEVLHQGRRVQARGGEWHKVAELHYNELGQVVRKYMGLDPTTDAPFEWRQDYNIRGWLTGINRDFAIGQNNERYFGMLLLYDRNQQEVSVGSAQFNGNIAATLWRGRSDGTQRRYDFGYDAANRLLRSVYSNPQGAPGPEDFSSLMGQGDNPLTAYDANGNILQMRQKGLKLGEVVDIDKLTYTYYAGTNKLALVREEVAAGATKGMGDFAGTDDAPQYAYDVNGNMVIDRNKSIGADVGNGVDVPEGAITYNHLNLPWKIAVRDNNGQYKGEIEYWYDAAGVKLRKTVTELARGAQRHTVTSTTYLGGAVYESKTVDSDPDASYPARLQFLAHEEGRIRWVPVIPNRCPAMAAPELVYDYYVKDHLGNVRMLLTEERRSICYPPATLEVQRIAGEKQLYDIQDAGVKNVADVPGAARPSFEQRFYELNGSAGINRKVGLGIALKVMAGDAINLRVESFYKRPATVSNQNGGIPILQLLQSFVNSGIAAGKGVASPQDMASVPGVGTALQPFTAQPPPNDRANAQLNWIFFDEQMRFVSGGTNAVAAWGGVDEGVYKEHLAQLAAEKSGYLYVFCSNESNFPVFFDNLSVKHTPGPVLEETHYYPFGLVMAGISAKSVSTMQNRVHYSSKEKQSEEFLNGSGLDWIDFGARMYNNSIGRWFVIDELSEKYSSHSPFNFVTNNPINGIDPDGRDVIFINDQNAVHGFGHGAVIIGNAQDGWRYYSLNGTGEGQNPYGDSKNADVGTFLGYGSNVDELIKKANSINPAEKHSYNRYVHVRTTKEEDKMMSTKAAKAASVRKYVVIGQSCINVQKEAFNFLVRSRVGFTGLFVTNEFNSEIAPTPWLSKLPVQFQNLNSYMYRWNISTNYFKPPRTATVVVGEAVPISQEQYENNLRR